LTRWATSSESQKVMFLSPPPPPAATTTTTAAGGGRAGPTAPPGQEGVGVSSTLSSQPQHTKFPTEPSTNRG
jgi:hypothetical protein